MTVLSTHPVKRRRIKPHTTIKDVASRAHVSTATVSHVINQTRYVEQHTKDRVIEAIRTLDYKPNVSARSLKGKGTQTIGVVIADITESFFSNVVKSIEWNLHKQDFSLILCDSEDEIEQEKFHIEELLRKGIDGLIFSPVDAQESYELLRLRPVPVVQFDRKTYKYQSDYVGIDNVKSAEIATRHLIDHGYERIGFVAYNQNVYTMERRLEGYRAALRYYGDAREPWIKVVDYHADAFDVQESIRAWLTEGEKIDAVICGVDNICYEVLGAATGAGLRIPQDVGIVSFDDTKWFKYMNPPITAIRQPTQDIGRIVVEMILNRIQQRSKEEFQEILLETRLIVRDSCGSHGE